MATGAAAALCGAAACIVAAKKLQCGPFANAKKPPPKRKEEFVGANAPSVKVFSKNPRQPPGHYRVAIVRGVLLIARQPGVPDDRVNLSGAQVVLQGTSVLLTPNGSLPMTLYFANIQEAGRWAAELQTACRQASKAISNQASSGTGSSNYSEKAASVRIQELEARVTATLHAAVDRSKRIKELEFCVEEGKARDQRIKELEEAVEETMQEANARGDRILELENILASRGGLPDAAASAVLQDAMNFAEQMLENREEELSLDAPGSECLREAVEAVKRSKPQVDGEVAELVSTLVTALRWPLVLRKRLADAEKTVREQRQIQEQTYKELTNLQQQAAMESFEKKQAQQDVSSLQRQLAIAEQTAEDAVGRLEEIHCETGGEVGGGALMDQQLQLEEAKRRQAETQATDLRERLVQAEQNSERAREQQREAMDSAHKCEVGNLMTKHEEMKVDYEAAQKEASELRSMLADAEKKTDEALAKHRQKLDEEHREKLGTFHQLSAAADEEKERAAVQAANLRAQLEKAEQAINSATLQQKERLGKEHAEEVTMLHKQYQQAASQRDQAMIQAEDLRDRLMQAEQANAQGHQSLKNADLEMLREKERLEEDFRAEIQQLNQRCNAQDAERERAMAQAAQLQEQLADLQRGDSVAELQKRHGVAQSQRDLSEKRVLELSQELDEAQRSAKEDVQRQQSALDESHKEEVREALAQHARAEAAVGQVEMKAQDLHNKLKAAEASMEEQASRQHKFLETERSRAFGGEPAAPSPAGPDGAAGPTDDLHDLKGNQERLADLERRLGSAGFNLSKGAAADGGQRGASETKKDLELRLLAAERAVDQMSTPAEDKPAPAGQALGSRTPGVPRNPTSSGGATVEAIAGSLRSRGSTHMPVLGKIPSATASAAKVSISQHQTRSGLSQRLPAARTNQP